MKIKIKVNTEYLYYNFFILMIVNNWCSDTDLLSYIYRFIKPLILLISVILAYIIVIKDKYTLIKILILSILIIAVGYTSYVTKNNWILYSMILISLSHNINIDKLIKIEFNYMTLFIIITLIIFLFQLIFVPDIVNITYNGISKKYSMGFIGANEAARYWIYWTLLFEYINFENKVSYLKNIVIFFITIFFYIFTGSDALFMIVFIFIFKSLRNIRCFRKFIEKFSGYSFGFFWLLSVLLLKIPGKVIFKFLDIIFTGRLNLGIRAINTYGITFIGQGGLEFYHWVEESINTGYRLVVDNAYYMIMIQYGIIYLIIITYIFYKSIGKCDYKTNVCLIIYSIFALAENTILSPTAVFPVIIAMNKYWKYMLNKKYTINKSE